MVGGPKSGRLRNMTLPMFRLSDDLRTAVVPLLLPAVMVLTLTFLVCRWQAVALASHLLLALYIAAEWPRLPRLPRTILYVSGGMLVTLPWFSATPFQTLFDALGRASWFATFLAALSYMREAAATSPLIHRCGDTIINHPPSKRYATLSGGAFIIGVLLSVAVLNLLGTMVQRANTLAAAGGNVTVHRLRTRRMFNALIRGFAAAPLGSPLTITLALILSLVPSVDWRTVLPLGVATTLLLIIFGWLWDWREVPRHLSCLIPAPVSRPGGIQIMLRLLALVFAVFCAAVAVEVLVGGALPVAILLTAPVAAFLWMMVQRRKRGWMRAAGLAAARLRRRSAEQFGCMRTEVCVLSAAGFMGTLIAHAVPDTLFAEMLAALGLHGLSVAVLVLLMMALLPQFGLNPVLVATIILSSMSRPEVFGLSPTILALATMCGWALSIASSPVATSILIAARIAGVSPQTAGWHWNGWFTLGATVLLCVWLWALAQFLG